MADGKDVLKGTIAGLVGGLAASWVMNEFQALVSKVKSDEDQHQQQPDEPATVKAAQSVAHLAGTELRDDQKQLGGEIAHYAMGGVSGAIYGAVTELLPLAASGWGTSFGAAVWLLGDEVAVPSLGLSKAPIEYPPSVHASALISHLVYGVTTDVIRRGLLRSLNS